MVNRKPMTNENNHDENGFLFNVDILIKSSTNAKALQQLLEAFNRNEDILDFRIKSGMELGQIIECLIQAKKKSVITRASKPAEKQVQAVPAKKEPLSKPQAATAKPADPPKKPTAGASGVPSFESNPSEWIKTHSKDNKLVRITTSLQGKKVSLPCRILNFDETNQLISVYHVDEKMVYTFAMSEIDDISAR